MLKYTGERDGKGNETITMLLKKTNNDRLIDGAIFDVDGTHA
jgi:hypothetical protein